MSRYYLHIANDRGITVDETGRDFPDDKLAVEEGARAAGQMLIDELGGPLSEVSLKIYVEAEEKRHVATVAVSGTLSY